MTKESLKGFPDSIVTLTLVSLFIMDADSRV
jgi:hypothetical protein